jgi:protocatechuate 3,4-dioxygenase beta subunit
MKVAAILPALALLAGTLGAQAPAAKPGSIEGTVTNSVTGEPVKKARVSLLATSFTTTTDAAGRFHLDSVGPGSYVISADHDGFMGTSNSAHQPSWPVTVAEEQHVHDVAIKLVPMAVVSGHVLDENGDPIPRAEVAVLRYSYQSARRRLGPSDRVQTNDLGEFEAINLQPGRYYFQVAVPRIGNIPPHTRWTRPEEAYPITYYPNAHEIAEATPTDVAAGARLSNIDFRLRKVPAYHIRGRVAGQTGGQPNTFDQFSILPSGVRASAIFQSGLQTDGSFDIAGVASGSYEASYSHAVIGKGDTPYPAQSVHVTDSDVNGIVFDLMREVEVSGTIAVEGAGPSTMPIYVALEPSESVFGAGGMAAPDGSFLIKSVPMEVCHLDLRFPPEGYYVKSIQLGDREIKNGEIDLTNGASGPLKIVLASDVGTIDGSVQTADGQPSAGTEVTVAPSEEYDGRTDLLKHATTDSAGHFHIKDVAPGDYRVSAWEIDPDQTSQSAEFRKLFDGKSAAVTVETKGAASVQLNVIGADDIARERSKLP